MNDLDSKVVEHIKAEIFLGKRRKTVEELISICYFSI